MSSAACRSAGTYHVIAISGGNVALLTALCFGIAAAAPCDRRACVAACTSGRALAYGGIVGGDPSVARAVTAACAVSRRRPGRSRAAPLATLRDGRVPSLAIADPLIVIDVGAWLSFGATLGILVLGRPRCHDIVRVGDAPPRMASVPSAIALAGR